MRALNRPRIDRFTTICVNNALREPRILKSSRVAPSLSMHAISKSAYCKEGLQTSNRWKEELSRGRILPGWNSVLRIQPSCTIILQKYKNKWSAYEHESYWPWTGQTRKRQPDANMEFSVRPRRPLHMYCGRYSYAADLCRPMTRFRILLYGKVSGLSPGSDFSQHVRSALGRFDILRSLFSIYTLQQCFCYHLP
jgi:hypothetical protein